MEILELENTVKTKISVDRDNSRMERTEERVSELEDRTIESPPSEPGRKIEYF